MIQSSIFSPLSKREKPVIAAYSLLNMLLLGTLASLTMASTVRRDLLTRGSSGMIDVIAVALSIVVTSPLVGLFLIRHPRFAQFKGSAAPDVKRLRFIILSFTIFGAACGLMARAWQEPAVTYLRIGIATLCFFLYSCGSTALNRSRILGR